MKKILLKACLTLPAFALIGCGGGSAGSNEGTAFYVDSAVSGVTVTCGSRVSLTDNTGAFTYVSGQTCTFSVGDVILRQESGIGGIAVGTTVFENNLPIAQFLQSLDVDNNPSNGITISAEVAKILKNNGITTLPSSDAQLESIVRILQNQGSSFFGAYVSKAEAQVHLDETANTLNTPTVMLAVPETPTVTVTTPENPTPPVPAPVPVPVPAPVPVPVPVPAPVPVPETPTVTVTPPKDETPVVDVASGAS